jgi:hypothetical protein
MESGVYRNAPNVPIQRRRRALAFLDAAMDFVGESDDDDSQQ